MAVILNNYTDLYRTVGVENRVMVLASALSVENINIYDLVRQKQQELQKQLNILKKKEQQLFSYFGDANGQKITTVEQLNKQLQEYKKCTLTLSGKEMNEEYIFQLRDANQISAKLLNEAARESIQLMVQQSMQEKGSKSFGQYVGSIFINKLNEGLEHRRGRRFEKMSNWDKTASLDDIQTFLFTTEQRARLIEVMKKQTEDNPEIDLPAIRKYLEEADAIRTDGEGKYTFNWFNLTRGGTKAPIKPSEVTKFLDDKTIAAINEKIMSKIISDVPTNYQPLMREVIHHILKQHGTAFFVGKNVQGIEGILGEIQSLFYVCLLTNNHPDEAKVYWRGGLRDNKGKKLSHQDIVVNGLGIQVKNTIDDIFETGKLNVGFTELKLDSFLDKIGVDDNIRNIFKNYYGTYVFNIPYVVKDGNYIHAQRSGYIPFDQARATLLSLQPQIDALMSLFSAILMYMDINEDVHNLSQQDANILYMLGGVTAITASSVIEKTLNQFKDFDSLRKVGQTSLTTLPVGELDIVSALNDKERSPNYSASVLNKITLQSAYKFEVKKY